MLLEPTFIASTVVATMRMRHQGHIAHGTSLLQGLFQDFAPGGGGANA